MNKTNIALIFIQADSSGISQCSPEPDGASLMRLRLLVVMIVLLFVLVRKYEMQRLLAPVRFWSPDPALNSYIWWEKYVRERDKRLVIAVSGYMANK